MNFFIKIWIYIKSFFLALYYWVKINVFKGSLPEQITKPEKSEDDLKWEKLASMATEEKDLKHPVTKVLDERISSDDPIIGLAVETPDLKVEYSSVGRSNDGPGVRRRV